MNYGHISVLPKETLHYLDVLNNKSFIDCTLGGGGHSKRILETNKEAQVLGLDQDQEALDYNKQHLASFKERFELRKLNFANLDNLSSDNKWAKVDAVLMDIGISSHHIDSQERGFSFMKDAPLDMRMDKSQNLTASDVLNTYSLEKLTNIFYQYGEEKNAYRISKKVIERRQEKKWSRTLEFAELIDSTLARGYKKTLPKPTKCFQALRIEVNNELESLKQGIKHAWNLLKKHGRLVIISFHSLEDRIVKHFFKSKEISCICSIDIPFCQCDTQQEGKILTRKVCTASTKEKENNTRSSCAKLRAIQKII